MSETTRRQQGGRRRALRLALEIGVIALGVHLVIPELAGLEATGRQLTHATWWLPASVLALEAASLWAYARLVGTGMERVGQPAPQGLLVRGVVVGTSLGRTLPGGNTTALAVIVNALHRAGLEPVGTATALATSGFLSSLVLAAMLPVAAVLALTTGHVGSILVAAAAVAVGLLALAPLAPWAARRPEALADRARRVAVKAARGPLRNRIHPDAVRDTVLRGAVGLRSLATDRSTLLVMGGWAAANWLLDVAVVLVLALTIGGGTPIAAILLAYIIAQLVASVPLTPGGVGIVETTMVAVLVAAGAPAAAATATVLGWRLISHWLPIGVGLLLLPTLHGGRLPR